MIYHSRPSEPSMFMLSVLLAVSIILVHVLHVPLYFAVALAGQLVEPLEHGVEYVEAGTDHCCEADHHNREIACLFGRWPGHLAELGRDIAELFAKPVKAPGLVGDNCCCCGTAILTDSRWLC